MISTNLAALFIDNSETYDLYLVLVRPPKRLFHWGWFPSKIMPMWPGGDKKTHVRLHLGLPGFEVFHA